MIRVTFTIMALISWASNPVVADTKEGFSDWRNALIGIDFAAVFGGGRVNSEYRIQQGGYIEIRTSKEIPGVLRSSVLEMISKSCKRETGILNQKIVQLPRGFFVKELFTQPSGGGFKGFFPNNIKARCLSLESASEKQTKFLASHNARIAEMTFKFAAQAAKEAEQLDAERAQVLQQKKTDCTSYGFTPTTDGHAKCVLDLAIAEKEMQQKMTRLQEQAAAKARAETRAETTRNYELTKLMSEANAASEAAAEDAKKQRQAQALMGLGSAISSGGMPSRSSTPPPNAPVSSGRYKTCTYRVAGEIVPVTVGRAELCSATKLIGGQTGYLVR